jgi:hypothetical protein
VRSGGNKLLGQPFLQELYIQSAADEKERLMTRMLGVIQKGRDETKLLMHYYEMKSSNGGPRKKGGEPVVVPSSEIGEAMYTLELEYDPDDDCYRGDQRYDVKLRHLIGMMPADLVKKIFSKDKQGTAKEGPPPQGLPMPQAEWHVLELYPTHAMYMHAFLANKTDERPLPMMGMQKPFRFEYV